MIRKQALYIFIEAGAMLLSVTGSRNNYCYTVSRSF